jgi:hypothetical protein
MPQLAARSKRVRTELRAGPRVADGNRILSGLQGERTVPVVGRVDREGEAAGRADRPPGTRPRRLRATSNPAASSRPHPHVVGRSGGRRRAREARRRSAIRRSDPVELVLPLHLLLLLPVEPVPVARSLRGLVGGVRSLPELKGAGTQDEACGQDRPRREPASAHAPVELCGPAGSCLAHVPQCCQRIVPRFRAGPGSPRRGMMARDPTARLAGSALSPCPTLVPKLL